MRRAGGGGGGGRRGRKPKEEGGERSFKRLILVFGSAGGGAHTGTNTRLRFLLATGVRVVRYGMRRGKTKKYRLTGYTEYDITLYLHSSFACPG